MSIFAEYDPWGRMGNRMFQYAFGLIISQLKKANFYYPELPNFNIKENLNCIPVSPIYTKSFGNNYVDLKLLLETENDIVINNFVQKAEYYLPYKNLLRDKFLISNNTINKDKLVLHIRETDYTQINKFLGYDYYKNFIKFTNFTDVIIVTDNSKCDTVKRLISEGCKLNSEGYVDKFLHSNDARGMQDFYTIAYSENVALSQSTFSWWGAFLGNHQKIFFPFSNSCNNWLIKPEKDDIDLFFNDPSCIKYIP